MTCGVCDVVWRWCGVMWCGVMWCVYNLVWRGAASVGGVVQCGVVWWCAVCVI